MARLVRSVSALLTAGLLLAGSLVHAGPMQGEGTGSGPQCGGSGVNNSGNVVGACVEADGSASGFVAMSAGSSVGLALLTSSRSCVAATITNSGVIVGSCLNANSLATAVVWNAAAPGVVQALQPLLGGIRTGATAFNQNGIVAGLSVNADGTAFPVVWSSGSTSAVALPAGLLGLGATNCAPTDVDDYAVSAATPQVVGNCPGSDGRPQPMSWTIGLLGGYVANTLPVPSSATFCGASAVVNGRILGYCDFGSQGGRTVLWPSASSTALILATTPARNSGTRLNANGEVIGRYQAADGHSVAYYWNTVTNTRIDIPALSGGVNADAADIGDNGLVVGTSEVANGDSHAFSWTLAGGSTDLGALAGGANSSAVTLSRSGCYLTGNSEVALHASQAYLENLCAP